MRYQEFTLKFNNFNLLSLKDIEKVFGPVNRSLLFRWKKEGKIISPRRGFYVLQSDKTDNLLLANELNYSYISLEFALSYHQIIPDVAQVISSVSKNRSEKFTNVFGNFSYRKISGELFTGFRLIPSQKRENRFIRIAEPEKALFDLVYFRPDLGAKADFESLRLLTDGLKIKKIEEYLTLVKAPQIKKRIIALINYLYDQVR